MRVIAYCTTEGHYLYLPFKGKGIYNNYFIPLVTEDEMYRWLSAYVSAIIGAGLSQWHTLPVKLTLPPFRAR